MEHEIFIIDDDTNIISIARESFKGEKEYKFKRIRADKIEAALRNIPELFIINEDNISVPALDLCLKIRNDEDNSITPIIVLSSNKGKRHRMDILSCAVEYFIKMPIDQDDFYYTVKNILRLINTNRRVSPLTRTTWKCTNPCRT